MKITKILYFAVISAGLLLSSCSMNKEANNTSYPQFGQLTAEQQLINKSAPKQATASVDVSQNQEVIQNDLIGASTNSKYVKVPGAQKHIKSFTQSNIIKEAGKTLSQVITVPKAIGTINSLIKKPAFTASTKSNPFAGMNYMVMWIVCLVASILLYAIGGLLGPVGLLFDILGLIAGIFFLVFLILWILELAKG